MRVDRRLLIGNGHDGNLRFWEAVGALIGFLISEFEIAEFCHRSCNGVWGDAMGRDEAEEQGFHVWRALK